MMSPTPVSAPRKEQLVWTEGYEAIALIDSHDVAIGWDLGPCLPRIEAGISGAYAAIPSSAAPDWAEGVFEKEALLMAA